MNAIAGQIGLRSHVRPTVKGRFVFLGDEKIYVRGVTYGPFRPRGESGDYVDPEAAENDFAQIASSGLNAVRTYTVPPRWLLDLASSRGLLVMVGIPWEQHVAFLDERRLARSIVERVRAAVHASADHPAVLCYEIGNEIPASIVRWHGRSRVEHFLERLHEAAKAEDPEALVTYVNYPSTEYLQLSCVDIVGFNVYLESQERLAAYLVRLQNIAGDRPLIIAEIGLDSLRHGREAQARILERQVRSVFAAGCAGAFVFSWTDEWHRGGYEIDDWNFGLTDRERRPKPALAAVRTAFAEAPFPSGLPWPRISVVVCSHNGERTLRDCFNGLLEVDYPDFEVVVVDDGSTDGTAAIATEYGFRLISTESRGLAGARNAGLEAATGEIVAYLDDDARPDPHWLKYLAAAFMSTDYAGVGGPNVAPAGDGLVAECVDNAPGGPVHVLLSDQEAEHIPGCNMAFRKGCLAAIGGFDPQFRTAGDDVDVCWRLQQQGWTLGFNAAAVVLHHRRGSVRAYWRQQVGYAKAETLLERKWPEKYNAGGHPIWSGRLYGKGLVPTLRRGRIYFGTWGSGLFQSIYRPPPSMIASLPLTREWYSVVLALAALSALGLLWKPLLLAAPALFVAVGATLVQAGLSATKASFRRAAPSRLSRLKLRGLTAFLFLLQPAARTWGRVSCGRTLRPRAHERGLCLPLAQTRVIWSERWQSAVERLCSVETALRANGTGVLRGGDYDRWDLEVREGVLGSARLRMAIEEHGAGRQLVRFRLWPRPSRVQGTLASLLGVVSVGAALDGAWGAFAILAAAALVIVLSALRQCTATLAAALRVLEQRAWDRAGELLPRAEWEAPSAKAAGARARPQPEASEA